MNLADQAPVTPIAGVARSSPVLVSVVAPCYNEEEVLPEFYRRTAAACRSAVGEQFELVLVDDGSKDSTWAKIAQIAQQDRCVTAVRLFRNHGHQRAVTAGLSVARGERLMLIDADLQDPPELLARMMAVMDEQDADVVYGQRAERKGESAFKLVTAALFYRILNKLSKVRIPPDTGDFRLMKRSVVDVLNSMPEQQRFIRGLVSWIGGRQVAFQYMRDARFAGKTKYPLAKMIRFAVDGITSFSTVPLRAAVWLGLASAALSFIVLVYALIQWVDGKVVPGWASSFIATAMFSGIQLLVLGVLGDYLGRVMEEVKQRPLFVIGTLYKHGRNHVLPVDFWRMPVAEQRALFERMERAEST